MTEAGEACAYHKERIAVTFCRSCNRSICRECVLTDQVLPRFYFSFWSIPRYRLLCPSCYISWHEPNAAILHKSRIKRTALWLAAMMIGFGFPILVRILAPQLYYFLPHEIIVIFLNALLLVLLFSMILLIPCFLLYIVILRKLLAFPRKARRIISTTAAT